VPIASLLAGRGTDDPAAGFDDLAVELPSAAAGFDDIAVELSSATSSFTFTLGTMFLLNKHLMMSPSTARF